MLTVISAAEQDFFTEQEAADLLGITLERVHFLLDENIFNDGSKRPKHLELHRSDIVLLQFWDRSTENLKVVRMPRRA
jgi:hypothetical protein